MSLRYVFSFYEIHQNLTPTFTRRPTREQIQNETRYRLNVAVKNNVFTILRLLLMQHHGRYHGRRARLGHVDNWIESAAVAAPIE